MSNATADTDETDSEVSYLAGVRAELTDLPPAEMADILDEVSAHLRDLTAELGPEVDLAARLGPPAAYAAELRTAAGYPASPDGAATPPPRALARLALAALVASPLLVMVGLALGDPAPMLLGLLAVLLAVPLLLRDGPRVPTVAALPVVRRLVAARPAPGTATGRVVDFVAALQPGWWLLRAVLAAAAVNTLFGHTGLVLTVLLTILGLPVSVWLGHLTRRDRRWLWAVTPLNALAAMLLVVIMAWSSASSALDRQASAPVSLQGLWQDSDRQILDIRPVDAGGAPLTGVYLFDQNGRPIDTSGSDTGCDDQYSAPPTTTVVAPYPRGTLDRDPSTGRCVVVPPGPLVVAVPSPTPTSVPPSTGTAGATASSPPTATVTTTPAAGPTR